MNQNSPSPFSSTRQTIARLSLIVIKFFSAFLFGIVVNLFFDTIESSTGVDKRRPSLAIVHVVGILVILEVIEQFDHTSAFYTKLGFLTSQVVALNHIANVVLSSNKELNKKVQP